jgi:methyl-accepting chemotaxis protein
MPIRNLLRTGTFSKGGSMNLIRSMSFRAKLIALCLFLSSVSGVISAVAINGLSHIGRDNARVAEKVMPKLEELNSMFLEYRRLRISLRTLGID